MDEYRLYNCVHSLVQQALVQNPRLYLTALAAMKTTNHRLISLPVPLLILPGSGQSRLMDPEFPFAKFIARNDEVPATRILYSLDDTKLHIGIDFLGKKEVKAWWDSCKGSLIEAKTRLRPKEFATLNLASGEFIAMPPQLLWSAERNIQTRLPTTPMAQPIKFVEVRYLSVTPKKELDFDYWPEGTYDEISRYNRDLLAPKVSGWGGEQIVHERRFKAAIELRGVWSIGDALLGLTAWRSPLVQIELHKLFTPQGGEWFNAEFVEEVQSRLDERLANMVDTLQLVHSYRFPPQSNTS